MSRSMGQQAMRPLGSNSGLKFARCYGVLMAQRTPEKKLLSAVVDHNLDSFVALCDTVMSDRDINFNYNNNGETILHYLASSEKNLPFLQHLLEKNAARAKEDPKYQYIDLNKESMYGATPLIKAAKANALQIMEALILYDPSIVSKQTSGMALAVAIEHKNIEMVKLLLDNGAKTLIPCFYGCVKTVAEYVKSIQGSDPKIAEIKKMVAAAPLYAVETDSALSLYPVEGERDCMEYKSLLGVVCLGGIDDTTPLLSQETDV